MDSDAFRPLPPFRPLTALCGRILLGARLVLAKMLAALRSPASPLGIRNRAMLLLGFGAALRRSELVGLRIGDVQLVPGRGVTVLVRRSKTDQYGRGQASRSQSGPTRRTLSPVPPSRSNAGWRCATPRPTSRAALGQRRATRCRCSAR